LDLFSGMCAVASAVAPNRPVWCNDVQYFAANVAAALFKSEAPPPKSRDSADLAYPYYSENKKALVDRFQEHLEEEQNGLATENVPYIDRLNNTLPHVATSVSLEREREHLARDSKSFPYRLFSITFAGGYLGLYQSIEVDAIRYAADRLFEEGILSRESHRWFILALCQAVSKVSTTTGHFAQYIKIKDRNKRTYLSQRRKSVWVAWLGSLDHLAPICGGRWRTRNRVFQEDAQSLLERLSSTADLPSIIYADPPYTDDQYSRYYHLYETLILYDYPRSTGVGRYRAQRFSSHFSLKSKVREAFDHMIGGCAKLGSNLVVSYPENGLLPNAKRSILSLLRKYFSHGEIARLVPHQHSSLGASKGKEKYSVTEMIFFAR